jgi:uncharacterized metal-binding protein
MYVPRELIADVALRMTVGLESSNSSERVNCYIYSIIDRNEKNSNKRKHSSLLYIQKI